MLVFLGILEFLSSDSKIVLVCKLFLSQVRSGFFEIFNLHTSMFFCLLAFFYVLFKVFLFHFQLLSELLDTLRWYINLFLHASILFKRRCKVCKPKILCLLKLFFVGLDFVWPGSTENLTVLFVEPTFIFAAAEDVNELKDVRLDVLSVFNGSMPRGKRSKHGTVQPLHLDGLNRAIDAFKLLLTKSLWV